MEKELIKSLGKVFTKTHILVICFFLLLNIITFAQDSIQIYSTDNYARTFVLNNKINRFCYFAYYENEASNPAYCRGNFTRRGDSIMIESDLNNRWLPLIVKCKKDSLSEKNKIIINLIICDYTLQEREWVEKKLYLIINNHDTISYSNDIIEYAEPIVSLQLSLFSKFKYPEYIDSSGTIYINEHFYSTEMFNNRDSCNIFEITFYYKTDFLFYKAIKGFLVINDSLADWHPYSTNGYYQMRRITIDKLLRIQEYCQCWDEDKSLYFDIDFPECEKKKLHD